MSFLSSLRRKLVLFNILVLAIYIATLLKDLKKPSLYDLAILTALPIATYIFLKKYTETL